jgi:tetratricopeptide (TPR) repeat protein
LSKKLRRKELRQPDEFVTISMKVGQWFRDNQRLVTIIGVASIVIVIGIASMVQWTTCSRESSSSGLWIALNKATAPVVSPDDEEEIPREIEHFDSRADRAKAAIKVYQSVIKQHGSSTAGQAARLGLASAQFGLGEYAEARALYEEFLADPHGLEAFEAVAVEGAGYCYEAQKNYDKALEMFRRLEKADEGNHQDLAKYHQGRILEKMNKQGDAAELYRNIVRRSEQATDEMVTNGYAFERAEARLAVIDPGADVLRNRSKGPDMAEILRKLRQGGAPPAGPPPGDEEME